MPYPVVDPEFVEKWYIEGFRKDFHDWLRRDILELRAASCLLFGRRPDRPSFSKGGLRLSARETLNNPDWLNNEPGIDTRFAFYELALQAVLSGKLQVIRDSRGRIFVAPSEIFEFAMKQGLKMKNPLRLVWLEAIEESASAAKDLVGERLECDAVDADTVSATVAENPTAPSKEREDDLAQKISLQSDTKRYPTPPGTTWGKVTLTVYDDGTLTARAKNGPSVDYTAEDLGLLDRRKKKPNLQWNLLKELADSTAVECPTDPRERGNFDKRIARLNSALQNLFGIFDSKPITLRSDPIKWKEGLTPYGCRYKCWEPILTLHLGNSKRVARQLGHM